MAPKGRRGQARLGATAAPAPTTRRSAPPQTDSESALPLPPTIIHENGSMESSFQAHITSGLDLSAPFESIGPANQPTSATPVIADISQAMSNLDVSDPPSMPRPVEHSAGVNEEDFDLNAISPAGSDAEESGFTDTTTPQILPSSGAQQLPQHATSASSTIRSAAKDVHMFFKPHSSDPSRKECIFCRKERELGKLKSDSEIMSYSATSSTTTYRNHLSKVHLEDWVNSCDHLKIAISGTAKELQAAVARVRQKRGGTQAAPINSPAASTQRPVYSPEAFIDAIIDFVVGDDQSINVIESPHLRRIFLMLREDLEDSDIPHRTLLRERIIEVWNEHIKTLSVQMKNAIGKISFTSDLWSDSNLTPFMAITAHWIEAAPIQTVMSREPQFLLKLRAELVGFHNLPGRHTGTHIANAFLQVIDRFGIDYKIGWITLDNATNNDTFMEKLEAELRQRKIPFDKKSRRIRCFPHIVNLACKAVLEAISDMDYACEPSDTEFAGFLEAVSGDPIATLRAAIRAIRISPLRRQVFAVLVEKYIGKKLELLRDMDVRWSSTYYMIDRAIRLEVPLMEMIETSEFEELRKYQLDEADWDALALCHQILSIPDAFQQLLSAEKTPTLCGAIPAFEHLMNQWRDLQANQPTARATIQSGLDKLQVYSNRTEIVPAYLVSMILNPRIKLSHYTQYAPEKVTSARTIFLRELQPYFHAIYGPGTPAPSRPSSIHIPTPASSDGELQGTVYPEGTPRRIRRLRAVHATSERTPAEVLGLGLQSHADSHQTGSLMSLEQEFELYLKDPMGANSVDIISYWQENQLRFPVLFRAALDYLAIQGSAVPCERVFSSAKETMTARRSRIGSNLMEALQMLKFSLNHGAGLDFSRGSSRKELEQELENYLQCRLGDV